MYKNKSALSGVKVEEKEEGEDIDEIKKSNNQLKSENQDLKDELKVWKAKYEQSQRQLKMYVSGQLNEKDLNAQSSGTCLNKPQGIIKPGSSTNNNKNPQKGRKVNYESDMDVDEYDDDQFDEDKIDDEIDYIKENQLSHLNVKLSPGTIIGDIMGTSFITRESTENESSIILNIYGKIMSDGSILVGKSSYQDADLTNLRNDKRAETGLKQGSRKKLSTDLTYIGKAFNILHCTIEAANTCKSIIRNLLGAEGANMPLEYFRVQGVQENYNFIISAIMENEQISPEMKQKAVNYKPIFVLEKFPPTLPLKNLYIVNSMNANRKKEYEMGIQYFESLEDQDQKKTLRWVCQLFGLERGHFAQLLKARDIPYEKRNKMGVSQERMQEIVDRSCVIGRNAAAIEFDMGTSTITKYRRLLNVSKTYEYTGKYSKSKSKST